MLSGMVLPLFQRASIGEGRVHKGDNSLGLLVEQYLMQS